MKIVFLDFDGVLNSIAFLATKQWMQDVLDPAAVSRLNIIVERSGAKVVISSTWRLKYALSELRDLLGSLGFHGEVIDRTPDILPEDAGYAGPSLIRCLEIQTWLDTQPESPESFVVLDDADLDSLAQNHVKTEFPTGLLDEHINEALRILSEVTPSGAGVFSAAPVSAPRSAPQSSPRAPVSAPAITPRR